jgi:hypothetical protein
MIAALGRKAMNFGIALEILKHGGMVKRTGWNGAGQHIYLEDQLGYTIPGGVFKGERREYAPVLCLYNAQGIHQPGWVPSQGDLMAEDWQPTDGSPIVNVVEPTLPAA